MIGPELLLNPTAWTVLALTLVVLRALFVMGQVAVESLRPIHLRHAQTVHERLHRKLAVLDRQPEAYVSAMAVGGHLALFGLVAMAFLMVDRVASGYAASVNHEWGAIGLAALTVLVPLELFALVFGDLVPRNIASVHPIRVAGALFGFIRTARTVLTPLVWPVQAVANLLTGRLRAAPSTIQNQAEEEIKNLVESASEAGELEQEERELITSVFSFNDTIAREVMTPRVDLDSTPVTVEPRELARIIRETGHSRIPLYEGTDDQIVGVVHAKDLLMALLPGRPVNLRQLMRVPLFVPENMNLQTLLREMRHRKSQLAVVQDEFGGTSGIVTIEDIVEELVGDIVDEYDQEEPEIQPVEGGWLVDGKTHWEDVNRAVGTDFDSEEFDTVGGHVFGLFGRQPDVGETIEADGWRFTVADTDSRRILRLRLERLAEGSGERARE